MRRLLQLVPIVILTAILGGCYGAAIGGGTYAVKASKRSELLPAAKAGDAEAQYQLGVSWCCMGPGFDTQTATEWLCRAAANRHALAQYELGRIYAGDVSRTPAPGQKLVKLATARESPVHAAYWFSLAAEQGIESAVDKRDELLEKLQPEQTRQLQIWSKDMATIPCEYNAVWTD